MVEIRNENLLKEGDKAYWIDAYDNLRGGQIAEITESEQGTTKWAKVLLFEQYGSGMRPVKLDKCWPTKEACRNAEHQRAKMQTAEYIDSIEDINGLVKFMYAHDLHTEFRDFDAAAAVKSRAKDLIGIELEDGVAETNIVEIKNENPPIAGERTWWNDRQGNMHEGIVYEIRTSTISGEPYAMVTEHKGLKSMRESAKLSQCWGTRKECIAAEERRAEAQVEAYKQSITGVGTLVKFMYEHDLYTEFRDEEAVAAVKERADDLLSINLDAADEEDFAKAVSGLTDEEQGMGQ